ncbi:MAG: hypothetical protein DRO93_02345 [Candidatus Thorarchaeota archaeon]|nr:MAG: hypothetical protein DRO93_02345 [Candidatus Thorarchaeota archaeon]
MFLSGRANNPVRLFQDHGGSSLDSFAKTSIQPEDDDWDDDWESDDDWEEEDWGDDWEDLDEDDEW